MTLAGAQIPSTGKSEIMWLKRDCQGVSVIGLYCLENELRGYHEDQEELRKNFQSFFSSFDVQSLIATCDG